MKNVLLFLLLAVAAFAQTAPVPLDAAVANVSAVKLPTYLAAGCAYNQLAGINCWGSAIVPVYDSAQIYESTTVDAFPIKVTVNGKAAYVFQTSVREGAHRVIIDDGKNAWLVGADAGYSFAQAVAGGSSTSGVSAAVTITYVRQLSTNWALMVPIRALYMPAIGGGGAWNPILEVGVVYKPTKK